MKNNDRILPFKVGCKLTMSLLEAYIKIPLGRKVLKLNSSGRRLPRMISALACSDPLHDSFNSFKVTLELHIMWHCKFNRSYRPEIY